MALRAYRKLEHLVIRSKRQRRSQSRRGRGADRGGSAPSQHIVEPRWRGCDRGPACVTCYVHENRIFHPLAGDVSGSPGGEIRSVAYIENAQTAVQIGIDHVAGGIDAHAAWIARYAHGKTACKQAAIAKSVGRRATAITTASLGRRHGGGIPGHRIHVARSQRRPCGILLQYCPERVIACKVC